MTRAALEILSKDEDGFFLMVENGHADQMTHALDRAQAICDMIALDQAIGVACEFQTQNPDTLIVFVGDHTHGLSIAGTVDEDKPGEDMRETVGTCQHAGFPDCTDEDGEGFPDRMDVSKRLIMFLGAFPDHCEILRPCPPWPMPTAAMSPTRPKRTLPAPCRAWAISRAAPAWDPFDRRRGVAGFGAGGQECRMENSDACRVLAEAWRGRRRATEPILSRHPCGAGISKRKEGYATGGQDAGFLAFDELCAGLGVPGHEVLPRLRDLDGRQGAMRGHLALAGHDGGGVLLLTRDLVAPRSDCGGGRDWPEDTVLVFPAGRTAFRQARSPCPACPSMARCGSRARTA